MHADRRTAAAAGVLFIIATVFGLASNAIVKPFTSVPVDLGRIAADPTPVFAAVLVKLIGFGACAGIAVAMYPVLRRHAVGLALGSVVFRAIESVFYLGAAVGLLVLVALSREVAGGAVDMAFAQQSAVLILAGTEISGFAVAVPFFGIGALLYYVVMYRAVLVPRWLAGWGVIAAVMAILASVLVLLEIVVPVTPVHVVLNVPILIQEMVLAVWLIARGFTPAVPAHETDASVAAGTPVAAGAA